MTFAKTIAAFEVSLISIHRSSDDDAGPNFPSSIEDELSLLFNGVDALGTAGDISSTLGDHLEKFTILGGGTFQLETP